MKSATGARSEMFFKARKAGRYRTHDGENETGVGPTKDLPTRCAFRKVNVVI